MTVKSLIDRLKDMPQDRDVILEVCPTNPLPWDSDLTTAGYIYYDGVYETSDNMVCIQAWY